MLFTTYSVFTSIPQQDNPSIERHVEEPGRTLIDLQQLEDGFRIATQVDIEVEGETAPLALMQYCRKIAAQND